MTLYKLTFIEKKYNCIKEFYKSTTNVDTLYNYIKSYDIPESEILRSGIFPNKSVIIRAYKDSASKEPTETQIFYKK